MKLNQIQTEHAKRLLKTGRYSPAQIARRFDCSVDDMLDLMNEIKGSEDTHTHDAKTKSGETIEDLHAKWLALCHNYQSLGDRLKDLGNILCIESSEFEMADTIKDMGLREGTAEKVCRKIREGFIVLPRKKVEVFFADDQCGCGGHEHG